MKAMIFSDLITSKNSFGQLFGITAFISVFIGFTTDNLITVTACMAAMIPFMFLFSISAYDEQNGWERFRLTLPMSRRQVALGRYASMALVSLCSLALGIVLGVVVGLVAQTWFSNSAPNMTLSEWGVLDIMGAGLAAQAVILLAASITLPLIMRFGMTKGIRFVPVVIILALSAGAAIFGNQSSIDIDPMAFLSGGEGAIIALFAIIFGIAVLVYVISALISAHLYEKRAL